MDIIKNSGNYKSHCFRKAYFQLIISVGYVEEISRNEIKSKIFKIWTYQNMTLPSRIS